MGNKKDSLGDRMKQYENVSRNYLTRKVPVIIRVDGKAFHTFTSGMKRPFDDILMSAMQQTMKALCEQVQGCVFGYTQSDEITLVLTDYKNIKTDAWFGYNIQKMASIAASTATAAFNKSFASLVYTHIFDDDEMTDYAYKMFNKKWNAVFDARCFSIPKDEVCNCLIWRQQDATRNSIESVGHAYFSQSALNKKSCNAIQEMLFSERGINWNDYPDDCKRGACCIKTTQTVVSNGSEVERSRWIIDKHIPIFTKDREYVEKFL